MVDGKKVYYTDGFGLDENTTFGSKNELYNYFGGMGVQPGQIDPDFQGGTHGGTTNLGKSNKTFTVGEYKFSSSGVMIAGPCGSEFCSDVDPDMKQQVQWDLVQAMSGTAATKSSERSKKAGTNVEKTHQCKNAYGHSYMCGPTDPRHPKYKPKQQDWSSMLYGAQEIDSRTAKKQKVWYDSRSERKAKKYSRPRKKGLRG